LNVRVGFGQRLDPSEWERVGEDPSIDHAGEFSEGSSRYSKETGSMRHDLLKDPPEITNSRPLFLPLLQILMYDDSSSVSVINHIVRTDLNVKKGGPEGVNPLTCVAGTWFEFDKIRNLLASASVPHVSDVLIPQDYNIGMPW
jgi:hypothetical protein